MFYVYPSTFVKRDVEILRNNFIVDEFEFASAKKHQVLISFFKQFIFVLTKIKDYKVIICQSSGYLSFLPIIFGKLFKIPTAIIAIGTESCSIPEINYGTNRKFLYSWFSKISLYNTSVILPVHKSMIHRTDEYFSSVQTSQGIKAFFPTIQTKIYPINYGYDFSKWQIVNEGKRKKDFLTITTSLGKTGYYLKGIDLVISLAKRMPQKSFTVVGKVWHPFKDLPSNITIIDHLSQLELADMYNAHNYYLQLSISEGFPNSLCEAMLCGCVPIGSSVSSIPEIISDKGFILLKKDVNLLVELVSKIKEKEFDRQVIRARIVDNYPIQKREKELIEVIKSLIK